MADIRVLALSPSTTPRIRIRPRDKNAEVLTFRNATIKTYNALTVRPSSPKSLHPNYFVYNSATGLERHNKQVGASYLVGYKFDPKTLVALFGNGVEEGEDVERLFQAASNGLMMDMNVATALPAGYHDCAGPSPQSLAQGDNCLGGKFPLELPMEDHSSESRRKTVAVVPPGAGGRPRWTGFATSGPRRMAAVLQERRTT